MKCNIVLLHVYNISVYATQSRIVYKSTYPFHVFDFRNLDICYAPQALKVLFFIKICK
jgi:hypothetical protein